MADAAYTQDIWTRDEVLRPAARTSLRRRILLHDYAGHAFQVQLSRALADRGHEVLHLYAATNPTPKGALAGRPHDAATLRISGLFAATPYQRYALVKRWRHERAYGGLLAERVRRWCPDVVICCNTPLDALRPLSRQCVRLGVPLVFWVQDLNGLAAKRILSRRLPGLGWLIGRYYEAMERAIARRSGALVIISPDFSPLVRAWGIGRDRVTTIQNWAPLDDVTPDARATAWSREQALSDQTTFMYTGMMGLKHNAGLILALADHFRGDPELAFVIISEGLGAEWLERKARENALGNLRVLGFQPYERLSEVLASADVLLATLEADAGAFAVPSKVLSYFCAGRPILAAVPQTNLAARLVAENQAGLVTDPDDRTAFVAAAARLAAQPALRQRLGRNGRRYAEKAFDIDTICRRFEAVIDRTASRPTGRGHPRSVREACHGEG